MQNITSFLAIDLSASSVYISSDTWNLVGVALDRSVLSERARQLNLTHGGGVGGTIRFLKNVGGLWLLQECQHQWDRDGQRFTWLELSALARTAAPLRSLVNPDAPDFRNPVDMPAVIRAYCQRTSQPAPEGVGAVVRCCLESLALEYRWVVAALEDLTGQPLDRIWIVDSGSEHALLCQFIADACGRRVIAVSADVTTMSNILIQTIAPDHIRDLTGRPRGAACVDASGRLRAARDRSLGRGDCGIRCARQRNALKKTLGVARQEAPCL